MRLFPEARFRVSYQVIVLIEGETIRTKKSLNVHLVAPILLRDSANSLEVTFLLSTTQHRSWPSM